MSKIGQAESLDFRERKLNVQRGFDKMFSKFTVYRTKYFSEGTFLDDLYTIFNLSGILINVFKKQLKIVERK